MTIIHTDLGLKQFSSHLFRRRQELVRHQRHPTHRQPSLLPNFISGGFLLIPKAKGRLAGLSLAQESLKKTCGGVSRNITAKTFADVFRSWFERREKCVSIGADRRWPCQEKLRKKVCSIMFTSCFINTFRVDFSHTS